MWDQHVSKIKVLQQWVQLNKMDNEPIYSSSLSRLVKGEEFEKHVIDQMPPMEVIEPVQN